MADPTDPLDENRPSEKTSEPAPLAAPEKPDPPQAVPVVPASPPKTEAPVLDAPKPSAPEPTSDEEIALLYELLGDRDRLTTVILVGASAMIPVPFLDDFAKGYLERRLFRIGAERESLTLSSEEADRLVQEPPSGCCLTGCLGKALIYPIKRLIRKLLFFLEIKRAVDQSTNALAESWLFSLALRRGLWAPGGDPAQADLMRQTIEKTCAAQGVKPLELAISGAFQGAKGTLFNFANRFIGKGGESKEELLATVDQFKKEEADQISKLTQKLQKEIEGISDAYLRRFAQGFETELQIAMTTPPDQGIA